MSNESGTAKGGTNLYKNILEYLKEPYVINGLLGILFFLVVIIVKFKEITNLHKIIKKYIKKHFFITGLLGILLFLVITVYIVQSYEPTDRNIWIGFYGSIWGGLIGGLATLIGVILTINKNNETIEDNNRLSLIPYITVNASKYDENKVINSVTFGNINDKCASEDNSAFALYFMNIGLGTAINLDFPRLGDFINVDSNEEINSRINLQPNKGNSSFYIENFHLPLRQINKAYELNLEINYLDITGKYKYKQEIKLELTAKQNRKNSVTVMGISSPKVIHVYSSGNS